MMKKVLAVATVVTVLALGAVAFAHGPGWSGGHMGPGYGYGPQMMGPGYGGHMMGWYGGNDKEFLEETADLRREMHNKRFEYFEAIRDPKTDPETVAKLEKEIIELRDKVHEKAPRTAYRGGGGYGHCW